MKTLKTLSALVKTISYSNDSDSMEEALNTIENHAKTLDLPVTLSQLIPCENGKPLEKPMLYCEQDCEPICCCSVEFTDIAERYQKACEAVLFEGWELRVNQLRLIGENYIIQIQNKGFSLLSNSLEILGTLSTLHDLAEATTDNPLKLKQ